MRTLLAGAAVLAALTAGCGGGSDDDDSGQSRQLTHAALVARANAVCRTSAAAVARVPAATTMDDLAGYAAALAPISARLHAELLKLTPSPLDRAGYERYLLAVKTSDGQLAALRAAAGDGDDAGVRAAVAKIVDARAGTQAADLGFDVCAAATPTP